MRKRNEELKKLREMAEFVDYKLFINDDIRLVCYSKNGGVGQKFTYDYDDPHCAESIRHHLMKRAIKRRKKWGPHFLELAPVAFQTECNVKIADYYVALCTTTVENGNPVETELYRYPFSGEGLNAMSDDISYLLYSSELTKSLPQAENGIRIGHEQAHAIADNFYDLLPGEQERFLNSIGENGRIFLDLALEIHERRIPDEEEDEKEHGGS